jgi:hypothetical protein
MIPNNFLCCKNKKEKSRREVKSAKNGGWGYLIKLESERLLLGYNLMMFNMQDVITPTNLA